MCRRTVPREVETAPGKTRDRTPKPRCATPRPDTVSVVDRDRRRSPFVPSSSLAFYVEPRQQRKLRPHLGWAGFLPVERPTSTRVHLPTSYKLVGRPHPKTRRARPVGSFLLVRLSHRPLVLPERGSTRRNRPTTLPLVVNPALGGTRDRRIRVTSRRLPYRLNTRPSTLVSVFVSLSMVSTTPSHPRKQRGAEGPHREIRTGHKPGPFSLILRPRPRRRRPPPHPSPHIK
mmetsp:Transcript_17660/g.50437  ORF Transcript_17660/g.50437 Transcript_17660/m.50437 type:complete len:231 (-) Transcript_17660:768-1460(-)